MKTVKLNIELALSRNFNKVSLGMIEEQINYEDDEDLKSQIRQKLNLIREEIDFEFSNIAK